MARHVIVGTRDSQQDQDANVRAVLRAETARRQMLEALNDGDEDRAHEQERIAEAATAECYERAMDRAANLQKIGDPRGELARANQQMIAHGQRRRAGYSR